MFAFRFQALRILAPAATPAITAADAPPARRAAIRMAIGAALCLALLAATGCQRNSARTIPSVLVPTIETQPQPAPPSPNPPDENADATPQEPPANTPPQDADKPKPKPRKVVHKPVPQPAAPAVVEAPKPEPPKPATPDSAVQITADVPKAAVQSQKQNTENLLHNSEDKLGHISRNLSESEQGMMRQARNYMTQSNQALQGGDIERAYNLAVKASLLANELAK
jgi:outer membrane biosynthesis protein TonB